MTHLVGREWGLTVGRPTTTATYTSADTAADHGRGRPPGTVYGHGDIGRGTSVAESGGQQHQQQQHRLWKGRRWRKLHRKAAAAAAVAASVHPYVWRRDARASRFSIATGRFHRRPCDVVTGCAPGTRRCRLRIWRTVIRETGRLRRPIRVFLSPPPPTTRITAILYTTKIFLLSFTRSPPSRSFFLVLSEPRAQARTHAQAQPSLHVFAAAIAAYHHRFDGGVRNVLREKAKIPIHRVKY